MQLRTKQGLQTLRRAHVFLVGREMSLAFGPLKPHAEALDALVQRLEQHAMEQDNRERGARAATEAKKSLGRALRQEYLRPISRIARAAFADNLQVRAAFTLPEQRDDERLLQAANGFAERAAEYKAVFVSRGLEDDFIDRLRKATAAFRESLVTRGVELGRRSAATTGMLQELARGKELVRLIDDMVAPRLATQGDLLSEWRTLMRFVRRSTSEVTDGGTQPGTQTAPTTPPAAPSLPSQPAPATVVTETTPPEAKAA